MLLEDEASFVWSVAHVSSRLHNGEQGPGPRGLVQEDREACKRQAPFVRSVIQGEQAHAEGKGQVPKRQSSGQEEIR